MRCDLAAALLHAPPILVLDEPTIGLDVAVKERIRAFIRERSEAEGVTVLLTSHDLGDIEGVCQRLVMLDAGRIVFDGPLADVRARWGRERVVHVLLASAVPEALAIAQAALPELPPAAFLQPEPHQLAVQFDAQHLTAGAIAGRLFPLLPVADLRIEEPGIEQIIRRLYRGELQVAEEVA
jgi:ABC-2 type transport system ATP-binding protein